MDGFSPLGGEICDQFYGLDCGSVFKVVSAHVHLLGLVF